MAASDDDLPDEVYSGVSESERTAELRRKFYDTGVERNRLRRRQLELRDLIERDPDNASVPGWKREMESVARLASSANCLCLEYGRALGADKPTELGKKHFAAQIAQIQQTVQALLDGHATTTDHQQIRLPSSPGQSSAVLGSSDQSSPAPR